MMNKTTHTQSQIANLEYAAMLSGLSMVGNDVSPSMIQSVRDFYASPAQIKINQPASTLLKR